MFEHPAGATSWKEKSVVEVAAMPDVGMCSVDMCAYGLRAQDQHGEGYAQKRTRLMTNMPALLEGMPRQCQGDHRHVILLDGRAKDAARYTDAFCKQVVKCAELQRLAEGGMTTRTS